MTNLDRLRRQTMGANEAAQAATEMSFLRADMLKIARMAKTAGWQSVLAVKSVRNMLKVMGEEL